MNIVLPARLSLKRADQFKLPVLNVLKDFKGLNKILHNEFTQKTVVLKQRNLKLTHPLS